jgi:hypothetical protein
MAERLAPLGTKPAPGRLFNRGEQLRADTSRT